MTQRSRTLRYKVLMGLVVLVIMAWTVVWFVVAGVVDRQAERAESAARAAGAIAECLNRSISGFPFRIEVRCGHGSRIGNADGHLSVDGLTAMAQIYKPSRLIMETQGPMFIAADGMPPLRADWDLAHASARIDIAQAALERLDMEVREGIIAVGAKPPVPFAELDLNLRKNPDDEDALDVALHLADIRPSASLGPLSIIFQGTLSNASGLLSGDPDGTLSALAGEGLMLLVDSASVETVATALNAGGTISIGPDGLLNGTLEVAFAGEGADLPLDGLIPKDTKDTIITLIDNVLAFAPQTHIGERIARKLTLTIRNGQVQAGFVPLFKIPPLLVIASL